MLRWSCPRWAMRCALLRSRCVFPFTFNKVPSPSRSQLLGAPCATLPKYYPAKQIVMYTGYHSVHRCFEETLSEGERLLLNEEGTPDGCIPAEPLRTEPYFTRRCSFVSTGGERAKWIRVHGSWLPRHINGRLHALFANLRCLWATVRHDISSCLPSEK
jgi:hypothetical protein